MCHTFQIINSNCILFDNIKSARIYSSPPCSISPIIKEWYLYSDDKYSLINTFMIFCLRYIGIEIHIYICTLAVQENLQQVKNTICWQGLYAKGSSSIICLKMKSTPEFNKFWKRKKKIPYRTVQKLWKSDKKEGSYDILKFHIFSENTSWPVLMNIQMSELMMSSPHNFLFISYTEMTNISYFSYENIKLAL